MKRNFVYVVVLCLLGGLAFATTNENNPKKYCDPKKPPTKPTPPPVKPSNPVHVISDIKNTATASAAANANSSSKAIATGGNASVGPINVTTKGGDSSVKDSGNSSIKDSGNSTNNIKTDQSQAQSNQQSQSATASDNGNGNGNNSNNTTYKQVRQTPTAYAPDVLSSVNCFKGIGLGVSAGFGAISGGGGKVDANCRAMMTAAFFGANGAREAMCKIAVQLQDAKKAGVTMEDCMATPPPVVEVIPPVVAAPAPEVVAYDSKVPLIYPPALPPTRFRALDKCDFRAGSSYVSNICKHKLDTAKVEFLHETDGYLIIDAGGDKLGHQRADNMRDFLVEVGVTPESVQTRYFKSPESSATVSFSSAPVGD